MGYDIHNHKGVWYIKLLHSLRVYVLHRRAISLTTERYVRSK